MENPFNLPIKFKYIIQSLNKLKIIDNNKAYIKPNKVVYFKKDYQDCILIITDRVHYIKQDITGVLANRFNTYIYDYLVTLQKAFPRKTKIIHQFMDYLREEDKIINKQDRIDRLRKEAEDLDCVVTLKPTKQ